MQKIFLLTASLSAALSVILGAFAAHSLKAKLSPEQLQVFETGVRYQFYHTFALFLIALLMDKIPNGIPVYAGISFILGIVLFSGSLYLLAAGTLLNMGNVSWLGPVTPIGGLCFIGGWVLLLAGILKTKL